jgi:hypothetical protein
LFLGKSIPAIRANGYPPFLSLTLLVPGILANDTHDAMTPNNFALSTNTLN